MTARYRISIFLLTAVASLFAFVPPYHAASLSFEGTVTKVIDEDTVIVVTLDGKKLLIRLYGIDGPEIRHGDKPGQPYGEESKAALVALALGKKVRVDIVDTDRYRRLVGMLYVDSVNVNEEMVKKGWAWAYGEYHGGSFLADFIQAERQARKNRRGLWQQDNPLPPWEHRLRNH